jgi:hypothetical protein
MAFLKDAAAGSTTATDSGNSAADSVMPARETAVAPSRVVLDQDVVQAVPRTSLRGFQTSGCCSARARATASSSPMSVSITTGGPASGSWAVVTSPPANIHARISSTKKGRASAVHAELRPATRGEVVAQSRSPPQERLATGLCSSGAVSHRLNPTKDAQRLD